MSSKTESRSPSGKFDDKQIQECRGDPGNCGHRRASRPSSAHAIGLKETDTPMEVKPKSEVLNPKIEAENQVEPELVAALSATQHSKEEERVVWLHF